MDYIFIIGPSGAGKTTLAKGLFRHYNGVYFEQNMVPEFAIPEGVDDEGMYEEQLCWDNVLLQLKFFHDRGFRNIIALDFDDLRSRDIPSAFKGYEFITIKLVSSDAEQIRQQMEYRKNHEGGLYMPETVERANHVIMRRKLLPNEVQIDIAGKTKKQVLEEAIRIIDGFKPQTDYRYETDDEHNYQSWVQSRKLF